MAVDTAVRLNLGCGDLRKDGFVNVDLREDVADVVADATDLSKWEDHSVVEILALDLLEHFPAFKTRNILREWRRVLEPGGTLTLKVPNMLRLAEAIIAHTELDDHGFVQMLIRNVYGGHRWGPDGSWDTHHQGFVPETLRMALEQAGFELLSNDEELNMTAVARKRL